jgi:hypothetical protein
LRKVWSGNGVASLKANAYMMVDASVEEFEKDATVKIIPTRWCYEFSGSKLSDYRLNRCRINELLPR